MSCSRETGAGQTVVPAPRAMRFPVLPLTIGAGDAVAHRGWAAALQQAMAAFRFGPAIVVVSGGPGTGKTLLLEELTHVLTEAGTPTTLWPRGDLWPEEVAPPGDAPFRILLIDEADRMDLAALASLATDPLTGLVLVRNRLPKDDEADPFTRALSSGKFLTTVQLGPLCPGEARALLDARLARSGVASNLVDDAALAALELYSGRIPRLLFMIAGAAFFFAESNGAFRLEAEHVAEGAACCGVSLPEPEEPVALPGAQPEEPAPLPEAQPEPSAGPPEAQPQIRLKEREQPIGVAWPEELIASRQPGPRPASLPRGRPEPAPDWVQRTRWPRSAKGAPARDRTVGQRRAAVLAFCLVACSAAAGGWVVVRQPTFRAAMHASGPAPLLPAAMPHTAATSRAALPVTPATAELRSEPSRVASAAVPAASPRAAPQPQSREYAETEAPVSPPTAAVRAPAASSTLALAVPPLPPAMPPPHKSSGPGLRPPYRRGLRMPRVPLHAVTPAAVEVRPQFVYQPQRVYQAPRFARQFQPFPPQYIGVYVPLPDGRRAFIPYP